MQTEVAVTRRRPRRFLNWKVVIGVGFSAGLLYFALRDVHFSEVLHEIRRADPLLFILAVAAATAVFPLRALRWRPILQPVNPNSAYRTRFAAVSIGFMANNLLPARMGEFARAYALSRLERVPITASLGSLVIERLFDGLTVAVFLVIAMADPNFPQLGLVGGQDLNSVTRLLVLAILGAGAVLLLMAIWPLRAVRTFEWLASFLLPRSMRRPVVDALEAFLQGIGAIRHPGLVLRVAGWSLVVWGMGALSFWLGFLAFDIHVPFAAALFLQSLVAVAVSLPSAPGFFGLFEAGARIGLVDVFGVEVSKAVGFAIGFHMGGFVPITLIGLYYVWRLGISWREVERSEELVERVVERTTGVDPLAPRDASSHPSNEFPPPLGDESGKAERGTGGS